jgi:hypothetical protein
MHTYHLTGDTYLIYEFGDAQAFSANNGLSELTMDLPPEMLLSEPELGIGFQIEGRLISQDTVRYQRVFRTLFDNDIMRTLQQHPSPLILEIGGGYGALARHLKIAVPNATVVIVDLPETLFYSGIFLAKNFGEDSVYVYSEQDWTPETLSSETVDFVLMPNTAFDRLAGTELQLAINMASFQEMRQSQAEGYLSCLRRSLSGPLYSCNQRLRNENPEAFDVIDTISGFFTVQDVSPRIAFKRRATSSISRFVRRWVLGRRDVLPVDEYVELLCWPRDQDTDSPGG